MSYSKTNPYAIKIKEAQAEAIRLTEQAYEWEKSMRGSLKAEASQELMKVLRENVLHDQLEVGYWKKNLRAGVSLCQGWSVEIIVTPYSCQDKLADLVSVKTALDKASGAYVAVTVHDASGKLRAQKKTSFEKADGGASFELESMCRAVLEDVAKRMAKG